MNIFYLSPNPISAAMMLCDQHIIKMNVESCQMLSTWMIVKYSVVDSTLMKPTHVTHPCNLWLQDNLDNVLWLCQHLQAIQQETKYRGFNLNSRCQDILAMAYDRVPLKKDVTVTPKLCMPNQFKVYNTPELCYCEYYRHKASTFAKPMRYTVRSKPEWL